MIVQFGTSRFLQAHVDLFASEARDAGQDVPGITIVQTTDDTERAKRLAAFADPAGFPVIVRGIEAGAPVERTVRVRSVVDGLQATRDREVLIALIRDRATHIVSNTGDLGYRVAPGSFPTILHDALHARWQAGGAGVTMLPCELVSRNGDVLRDTVAGLAEDAAFAAWLTRDCRWVNTLVDRIVSTPLEPAGAIAEPYALWAVETQPGLAMPFTHPAIVLTDDLERFERLKLHILNLGHTWLADRWARAGAVPGVTVRAAMADPATRAALEHVMAAEVVPGFAAHGLGEAAATYVATTLERFDNPFLDHLLSDIHAHHPQKIAKRVGGFVSWVGDGAALPELRALAARGA
ncbi:mannitol dehydrogenase family protein [uncultured Sphingomonas sp.]|uniref:mannitol dehydrogenase family protein n=1 Tax=uncultured Sphingomonas sp. TaxID=158754 RepID=UPI0025FD96A3|nr:mannitol dehydrogenase family protein [uncultured Sphingomonas sp.]